MRAPRWRSAPRAGSSRPSLPAGTRIGRMTPPSSVQAVTLEGRLVRLEPLSLDHVAPLAEVALDPAIWQWTIARPRSIDDLRAWAEAALASRAAGAEMPFATIERSTGRP